METVTETGGSVRSRVISEQGSTRPRSPNIGRNRSLHSGARYRHFVLGAQMTLWLWSGRGGEEVLISFHLLEDVQNVVDYPFTSIQLLAERTEPFGKVTLERR